MTKEKEAAHLALLNDMGHELAVVLENLRGKPAPPLNRYLFPMCKGLCLLTAGFLDLKKEKNEHAARVLIRTAIETALKLAAVHEKPITLYRVAYSEHHEDGKFLKAADEKHLVTDPAKHAAKWKKDRTPLVALFHGEELKDETISAYDLAQIAKRPHLYDFYFRLYCNYTHATLRAHVNPEHFMRETDFLALEEVTHIALFVVEKAFGVSCLNLSAYEDRIKALGATEGEVNGSGLAGPDGE